MDYQQRRIATTNPQEGEFIIKEIEPSVLERILIECIRALCGDEKKETEEASTLVLFQTNYLPLELACAVQSILLEWFPNNIDHWVSIHINQLVLL